MLQTYLKCLFSLLIKVNEFNLNVICIDFPVLTVTVKGKKEWTKPGLVMPQLLFFFNNDLKICHLLIPNSYLCAFMNSVTYSLLMLLKQWSVLLKTGDDAFRNVIFFLSFFKSQPKTFLETTQTWATVRFFHVKWWKTLMDWTDIEVTS